LYAQLACVVVKRFVVIEFPGSGEDRCLPDFESCELRMFDLPFMIADGYLVPDQLILQLIARYPEYFAYRFDGPLLIDVQTL
jgi:hypothetical protein